MEAYAPHMAIGASVLFLIAGIVDYILLRRKAKLWEGREDGR